MAGPSLITGATGFAGGHLLERLIAHGETVHAWGHTALSLSGLPRHSAGGATAGHSAGGATADSVTWRAVDLLDRAAVREALDAARPSIVYHCAGFAHLQDAWRHPGRALQVNVLGTHHLLEAVREVGLSCRILITGSAQVYRPCTTAISEDSPIGPDNPYGISKLAQELMAAASPIPAWLVRPFNHAGPRQLPAYATSAFAQQIAEIEVGRREPVLHVGNLDAQRDITDVRDTVRAYHAIAGSGQPSRPYNVCSGQTHTMRRLLDILLSLAQVRVRVEIDPARLRPSDNPVILGSHARLTADTGWTPVIPIEQTLADLLEHWRRATAV